MLVIWVIHIGDPSLPQDVCWWLGFFLITVFGAVWVLPLSVFSKVLGVIWFQDTADLALELSPRRPPRFPGIADSSSTSCLRPSSSCRNQNARVAVRHRKELACHSGLVCPAFLTRQSSRLVSGSSSLSSFLDSSSLKKRPGKAQLLQMRLFSLVFLNNSLFHKTVSL